MNETCKRLFSFDKGKQKAFKQGLARPVLRPERPRRLQPLMRSRDATNEARSPRSSTPSLCPLRLSTEPSQ